MKKQNDKTTEKSNVIDMTERIQAPDAMERLRHLKVRFDIERAKVALSTSLLSIVVLVTLANNDLMSSTQVEPVNQGGRGIASVSTGTSDAEDEFVRALARRDLQSEDAIGRKPSSLETLAFETLEGKYSVRLENGKLAELEFTETTTGDDSPKHIDDFAKFFDKNRELLPVAYDKPVRINHAAADGGEVKETYQLINEISRPVANVEVRKDAAGRLLSMRFVPMQVAVR